MDELLDRTITDWDEDAVARWLASLGYPQYEAHIKEHSISGDILCMMDSETLKSVGVATIGQRLHILKSVYMIKLAHKVPFEADDYIPPSEAEGRAEGITVEKLHATVKDQAERLRMLEEENRIMNNTLQSFLDDYNTLRESLVRSTNSSEDNPMLRRQPSFTWATYKPTKSPTKPDIDTPQGSPQQPEHDATPHSRVPPPLPLLQHTVSAITPEKRRNAFNDPSAPKPSRQDSSDNLHKFKVSLEDPTHKVLPAALKKYKINNDNWEDYAMFICFGATGNRIERCLSYDEKPLLLFQKLKDAKKNPVFMLKHIKDIRSPIVVAQQKHAARKASSVMTNDGNAPASSKPTRPVTRPPRLEVQDLSVNASSIPSGLSPQPGWPDLAISSPLVEQAQDGSSPLNSAGTQGTTNSTISGTTLNASSNGHDASTSKASPESNPHSGREMLPSSGVSYAVAIYPYMAEQEDEFDVVVGDTFVIISRARGWWVVQRDPTGSGVVDNDISKHGWVPAGCLLETSVPVASAIAEANAAKHGNTPSSPASKTPILPLSIISTSFPGIALTDYKKKGDEELDLHTNDLLRVFKRYNHWSYAVKEDGGDRGWVPSWFIGKVNPPNSAGTPPTSAGAGLGGSISLDDSGNQPSPMSSAFPPEQK